MDLDKQIKIAVKTGDISFGCKEALRSLKMGKSQVVILASNVPKSSRELIRSASEASSIPLYPYKGNSLKLGIVCGKPFAISALTVRRPGDSEIVKKVKSESDLEDTLD